jgi:CubicO group peptidase (beta-lactamase class C family)
MPGERLRAVYQTYKDGFSGACLVTRGAEVLLSEANGLANRDFNIANSVNTRFDTASVTKLFTAAAILQLAQQGALRLDDKVRDILDLKGTAIPDDIRLTHLLDHTSGIADDADEEAGEDYSALFIHKPNYALRNCADYLPQFAYKPPNFKAGTGVRYNNCAFILLGLVVAVARVHRHDTHAPLRVYATAQIWHLAHGIRLRIY